ncbi:MAG TPA: hypothetical protein VHO07_20105, partial [Streptosporangiaceae bacterium]|nr:hypothetical protein [Streptosporangiaceae bacterium]
MWVDNDITAFADGTPAFGDGSSLYGYVQSDGSQHVNFIDGTIESGLGHVHELYRTPTGQWVDNDLTKFSGGTPALVGGTGPLGEYSDDGSQHVLFFDVNEHVHGLYRSPAAQWADNDLTALAAGTLPANGSALHEAYAKPAIDGNLGATAAVAEMLVHSHGERIEPLPALPRAWPDGQVTGLRARGRITVGLSWAGGRATQASLDLPTGATAV